MAEKLDIDEVEDTEDIYEDEQLEEMVEEDEVSEGEAGFMEGYDASDKSEDALVSNLRKKRKLFERNAFNERKRLERLAKKKKDEEPDRLILTPAKPKTAPKKKTAQKTRSAPKATSRKAKVAPRAKKKR
jgi:hypothetical protein